MPERLWTREIRDLCVGESTWAVPWALYLDADGECWLNEKYGQCDVPGGTVAMRVTRIEDGYVCDISRCRDHGWSRDGACFVGGALPGRVVELIGA